MGVDSARLSQGPKLTGRVGVQAVDLTFRAVSQDVVK